MMQVEGQTGNKTGRSFFRRKNDRPTAHEANILLAWMAIAGLIGVITYCFQFSAAVGWSVFAVSIAVAGAAALLGSLIGLLFGIPRIESAQPNASKEPPDPSSVDADTYEPNSNLVQISDWLTKILVGVGLTQIGNLGPGAATLGNALSPALGGTASSASFGVALTLYFFVLGFLIGYIETRTVLAGAFRDADRNLNAIISKKLETLQEKDARALWLVQKQLDLTPDDPPVPMEDLVSALRDASPSVKVQTFMRARDARRRRRTAEPAKLAQVAPIFRALIAIDDQGRYHRNHGQLAYALKDQPVPQLQEAIAELTNAIAMRDKVDETVRYRLYEFNRAESRMKLGQTGPEDRDNILADLKVAARSKYLREKIAGEQAIVQWMATNGLAMDSLVTP